MTQHRKRGDGCRALLAYFREIADGEGIARCTMTAAALATGGDARTIGLSLDLLVIADCIEDVGPEEYRLTGKDYRDRMPMRTEPRVAPPLAFDPDEDEAGDSISVMPGAVFTSSSGAEAFVHRVICSESKTQRRFPISLARVRFVERRISL